MNNIYLKENDHGGDYDTYYHVIKDRDSLKEKLSIIDLIIDRKYLENNDNVVGIKLDLEIVELTPEEEAEICWD